MGKQKYDPIIFCQRESLNMDDFIVATYWAKAETVDVLMRAGAMAVEQTTGTWMRVPDETDEVRRGHVGRVISVYNVPGYELACPTKERTFIMQIAFPWKNIGQQLPELLSTVFGNISMSGNLKLLDLEFPKSFTDGFRGPRFGVKGVRELTGCIDRPPVLAMIKPCTGIPIDVIEKQFYKLCRAGIDIVKDDELIADPVHAPFYKRLETCLKVSDKVYAETGHRTLYVPNITDRQDKVFEKAHRAVEMGAKALMLNAHASGYGLLGALAADDSINVPLLAHPCYAGASYVSPDSGIASSLVFGKFMRLEGADIVVYPCAYGKVPGLADRYIRSGQSMLSEFNGMKNCFPSPAAGLYPGMVPAIMSDLGPDVMLGAGAAMHAHPMGLKAGVDALHQAAEAWMKNIPLEEYAKDHSELQASIDIWGVYNHNKSIFELTN
jgi:2,3-diketo-5-methylthiopentyl-1-phosphate enolase